MKFRAKSSRSRREPWPSLTYKFALLTSIRRKIWRKEQLIRNVSSKKKTKTRLLALPVWLEMDSFSQKHFRGRWPKPRLESNKLPNAPKLPLSPSKNRNWSAWNSKPSPSAPPLKRPRQQPYLRHPSMKPSHKLSTRSITNLTTSSTIALRTVEPTWWPSMAAENSRT